MRRGASNLSLHSGSADHPISWCKWRTVSEMVPTSPNSLSSCLPPWSCLHPFHVSLLDFLKPIFSLGWLPVKSCMREKMLSGVCVCVCFAGLSFRHTYRHFHCLRTSSNYVLINSLPISLFIASFICVVFFCDCELFLLTLRLAFIVIELHICRAETFLLKPQRLHRPK